MSIAFCKKTVSFTAKQEKFDKDLCFIGTKVDGNWLYEEDQVLYLMQVESQSFIDCTVSKVASRSSIHPPKRCRTYTYKLDIPITSESSMKSASTSSEYAVRDQILIQIPEF